MYTLMNKNKPLIDFHWEGNPAIGLSPVMDKVYVQPWFITDFSRWLAEYVITDALILNEDRHLGNFGILCDADTFEITSMAPIYDNGVSLLCYYHVDPRYPASNPGTMMEYTKTRIPRLYAEFLPGAKAVATKEQLEQLRVLKDFRFDTSGGHNLPSEWVEQLEEIVQGQAAALLS